MKILYSLIILAGLSNLFCQQLELEKIDDFMIVQSYLVRDNVIAEDGYLYTLSVYGLEIYEIGANGELSLQSRLPILLGNSIVKKDEFIYISSAYFSVTNQWGKLYKINVEDIQNPVVVLDIELDYYTWPIEVFGEILHVEMYNIANSEYINQFYSLPDLSILAQHQNYLKFIEKLNDSIALRFDNYNQFTVFDVSDPLYPEVIGSGDVSAVHQNSIQRTIAYNDTILICSENSLISFWNVSDWNNWEYISQYSLQFNLFMDFKPLIIDSLLVLVEYGNVELIEISDINNPVQLFILSGTADQYSIAYIDNYNDNLYISTSHNGIQRLKLNNNTLNFENEYAEYYLSIPEQHDNYLISNPRDQTFQYYDFTNPTSPNDLGDFIQNYNFLFELSNSRLAAFQDGFWDYDIYDISNINNPIITNQIEFDYFHSCRFGNISNNSIYFNDEFNTQLKKYSISQPGTNDLIFEVDLSFQPMDWLIYNGHGYFLEFVEPNNRRLYIYEGLDTDQPSLCNTIDNFVTNPDTRMKIVDGLLAVYTNYADAILPANRTRFFDISVPDQPAFAFSVNTYGEPFIQDDLVFTATYYECYVFVKPEVPTGAIEPLHVFYDVSNINNIGFVEYDNGNYLILCELSHTGIYSYEYTPLGADNEITFTPDTLSNHPNPFNPSTEISFQTSDFSEIESAEIVIYNIKGQKVRVFTFPNGSLGTSDQLSSGQHSITWDGTDQNNQVVSSGVYFYQLEVDGKAVATKKCLLLK